MKVQKMRKSLCMLLFALTMLLSAGATEQQYVWAATTYFTESGIEYYLSDDGTVTDTEQGLVYEYNASSSTYSVVRTNYTNCKEIVIPDTIKGKKVTQIADYAFSSDEVVKVTLGNNITSIGKSAFSYCYDLEGVVLPKNLTKIGESAFQYSGITSIEIPANVKTIGMGAFSRCESLATIKIAEGSLKAIPDSCFSGNKALKQITLPKGITKIGTRAFAECDALEKVVIKGKVKTIPNSCFRDCPVLKNAKIPSTVTKIEDYAFYNTGIENLTIPAKVKLLGYDVFAYCEQLKVVTINGALKELPSYTFSNCSALEKVTLAGAIKEIKDYAFSNCTSLYQVSISKKVKAEIDSNTFRGCDTQKLTIIAPTNSDAYRNYYESKEVLVTNSKKFGFNVNTGLVLVGEYKQIRAYNYPGTLKWKSAKKSVLDISAEGFITAKKPGQANITATGGNQKITLRMKVLNRTKDNVMKVITSEYVRPEMSDYEKVVAAHAWLVQNVEYDYDNYLNGTIPWSSYTADGAFVDGVAVCQGYALAFKEIMDYYEIPCKYVTSWDMNHGWNAVKIDGHWYHVDCTWDDPIVNGSSKNTHVYTNYLLVSDSEMSDHYGYSVNCNTSSNAKVDRKSKTSSATSNQKVTEKSPVDPYLNAFRVTLIKGGDNYTLKLTGTKAKKFSSTNSRVATVNKKGVITAKKKGTATIKVKGADGKVYTCKVTVQEPKLNKKKASLTDGQTIKLKVTGTKEAVTWKSKNPKIAVVLPDGTVTAVGNGTAKIVAEVGGYEMTCTVTCHKHAYQWKVTKQPSKTEATSESDFGTRVYQCSGCKKVQYTQSIINVGGTLAYGCFDKDNAKRMLEYVYDYDNQSVPAVAQDATLNVKAMIAAAKVAATGDGDFIWWYPGGWQCWSGDSYTDSYLRYLFEDCSYSFDMEEYTKIGTACFYLDSDNDGILEGELGYWVALFE